MKKWLIAALLMGASSVGFANQIDQIVVFGDSLSDNGNILSLTTKAHKVFPNVPITPKNPPYYEGRFSNGPVWIDHLGTMLNVPVKDFAYGGAWAEPLHDSRLLVPFSIGMQVDFYLVGAVGDYNKDKHLYIIWAGGNDYVMGREDPDYATTNTVNYIENQIDWLTYYGAKNVMVMNLPDLSVVPEVTKQGPDAVQTVDKLVKMHNRKLIKMVKDMQAKHPDAKIIFGDVTSYFNDTYQHPEKYNIKEVHKACYGGEYSLRSILAKVKPAEINAALEQKIDIMGSPSLRTAYLTSKLADDGVEPCQNPDEYMFWDQIHPTRVVHQLMAFDVMNILKENDIQGA